MSWPRRKRVNQVATFFSVAFGAKFGEKVLHDYMSLPLPSLVLAFLTIVTALAIPAAVFLFWPKDQCYLTSFRLLLRRLYDYLWGFIMGGLGAEFVVLATNLSPFWMLWGTWLAFGLWGFLLYDIWLMREPLNMRLVGEWAFRRFGVHLQSATDNGTQ